MEDTRPENDRPIPSGSGRGSDENERRSSLVDFLLSKKIAKYKDKDFELEFSPMAFIPQQQIDKDFSFKAEDDIDELLYFSAPRRPGGNL